ncbi:MAG TPA: SpoIIE family protein phosphatase [Candidatus Baltobacteraceae bacterium]|nr:SpoIIE family protein phosphatase [Candidatus Baltobacteraceae bacterium]
MEEIAYTGEDREWMPLDDATGPARLRRAAVLIASGLGISEHRAAEVAIAVTEVATNAYKYGKNAKAVLRVLRAQGFAALEAVIFDAGPGIADIAAASKDGFSTGGTLGVGIGSAKRLSSSYASHSVIGKGTVTVLRFWQPGAPAQAQAPAAVAGITRPINGEVQCGDSWAHRSDGRRTMLMLADGLGHGELAATASRAAVSAFLASRPLAPGAMLKEIDVALRHTRGAAAAVIAFERSSGVLTFAGVGNVGVWIESDGLRKGLPSQPGIVGSFSRAIRDVEFALPPHALVVMHSDGLTSKWDLGAYPGIRMQDPAIVAATLMRDAGTHHDDASALVAKAS